MRVEIKDKNNFVKTFNQIYPEKKIENINGVSIDSRLIDDYDIFLEELTKILGKCTRVLKPQKYMAVIVSDFRDKSRYYMFHSDLAASLSKMGLEIRGLKTLYQRHKRIFP